jgi:cbb3-type cytochrome oxidase subunit 3
MNSIKEYIINNSPIIGLIFFILIFCGVVVYLLRPQTKKECEKYSKIPLKDD